ncbi:MAG: hypothetical protein AAGB93_13905 [Planctomycetota bacterium]
MKAQRPSALVLAATLAMACASAPDASTGAQEQAAEATAQVETEQPGNMFELLAWYEKTQGGNFTFSTSTRDLLQSIEWTTIGEGDIQITKISVRED